VGVQRSPEAESDHPGLDQAAAGVSSAPPEPAREGEAHRRRWSLFRRGGSS
jgi:hypothetical protein